jgi:hypothetical protein
LVSGKLNTILTRPVSSYYFLSISNLRGSVIPFTIAYSILTILLVILNKEYSHYILAFFSVTIGFLVQVQLLNMIFSMSFFIKESGFLFKLYYHNLNLAVETYTPKFFEKTSFSFVMNMFPVAFICYFFVEILNGRTQDFWYYLPFFVLFGISCCIIIKILWYYGLRKYEAFG